MPTHLDLLAVALVSCAVACAAGTDPETLPTSPTDAPVAPRVLLPTLPSSGPASTATTATPPPASQEVLGAYSLDVACADVPVLHLCILGASADKDVVFTLPEGTKRSSIVYTVDARGPSSSGTVDWAGPDALDGTVHLHGEADAFSSVHVAVTGVMVEPE